MFEATNRLLLFFRLGSVGRSGSRGSSVSRSGSGRRGSFGGRRSSSGRRSGFNSRGGGRSGFFLLGASGERNGNQGGNEERLFHFSVPLNDMQRRESEEFFRPNEICLEYRARYPTRPVVNYITTPVKARCVKAGDGYRPRFVAAVQRSDCSHNASNRCNMACA